MKFDNEKRRFLTEKYARLESITLVQRACRANYKTKDAPARNTILNILTKFRKTGNSSFKPATTKKKTVVTEELIEKLKNVILEDPQISIRKTTQLVPASYHTVRNVFKNNLKLKPYKKIKTFHLKVADRDKRLKFARWVLNTRLNLKTNFICTDEAYFYLNGDLNVQNDRYWANKNPNIIVEQPLRDMKVLVWCRFSGKSMYGPYFFENTVNWQNYLDMLKK